jgi:phosphotransferase system enzyme I (PtsI)
MKGIPASPGLAVGPACLYRRRDPGYGSSHIPQERVETEIGRFRGGRARAGEQLETLRQRTAERLGEAKAEIFESHIEILNDEEMGDAVEQAIRVDLLTAEAACTRVIARNAEELDAMEKQYFRERAADIRDIGARLCACVAGGGSSDPLAFPSPVVLVAEDLSPSETAGMDAEMILGIVTERGGPTSHVAIMAKSLGIPAVVSVGGIVASVAEGDMIVLDGDTGEIDIRPSRASVAAAGRRLAALRERAARQDTQKDLPAMTRDGKRVPVFANIGAPDEAVKARELGAEGIGLFRTEFLFMSCENIPGVEEQRIAYSRAAAAMGEAEMIVRTLDVGGDKPIPSVSFPDEENPFLGWRGIRMCFDLPDLFETQLEALYRATADAHVSVMFPMVNSVEETRELKSIMLRVRQRLEAAGVSLGKEPALGIMIETPAAVLMAPELAREVDFFSIGTNDLTQYMLAVDRGNARIATLYDPLHPAVVRAIAETISAAHGAGKPVCMCGELAGDTFAIPLLVGLGLDTLSMAAPLIPAAKETIRSISSTEAQQLASAALGAATTGEVRRLLEQFRAGGRDR